MTDGMMMVVAVVEVCVPIGGRAAAVRTAAAASSAALRCVRSSRQCFMTTRTLASMRAYDARVVALPASAAAAAPCASARRDRRSAMTVSLFPSSRAASSASSCRVAMSSCRRATSSRPRRMSAPSAASLVDSRDFCWAMTSLACATSCFSAPMSDDWAAHWVERASAARRASARSCAYFASTWAYLCRMWASKSASSSGIAAAAALSAASIASRSRSSAFRFACRYTCAIPSSAAAAAGAASAPPAAAAAPAGPLDDFFSMSFSIVSR